MTGLEGIRYRIVTLAATKTEPQRTANLSKFGDNLYLLRRRMFPRYTEVTMLSKKMYFERPFWDRQKNIKYDKVIYRKSIDGYESEQESYVRRVLNEEGKPVGRWIEIRNNLAGHLSYLKDIEGNITQIFDDSMVKNKKRAQWIETGTNLTKKCAKEVAEFLGIELPTKNA